MSLTIEQKIAALQVWRGAPATVHITAGPTWVTAEQIGSTWKRVTVGSGKTLDEALDNLKAQVDFKDRAGIVTSGGVTG